MSTMLIKKRLFGLIHKLSLNKISITYLISKTLLILQKKLFMSFINNNLHLDAKKEIENVEKNSKILKDYYKAIFENTGTAIVVIREDAIICRVNHEFENLCGYLKDEVEDKKNFKEFLPEEEVERISSYYSLKCSDPFLHPKTYESYLIHKNGDILNVYVTVTLISHTRKWLVSIQDITKLKKTENDLKASIKEKKILLREINHRVKNNLQIVYSLLNLEKNYVNGKEATKLLQSTQNRVNAMILVHGMIHESTNLSNINFQVYIQKLVYDLFYTYGAKNNIKLAFNVDKIFLNIETVIPCGLIVSEIVYNSIKYAFPNNKAGKILVEFYSCDNDEFELIIKDNGRNLPKNINFNNENSFGLLLIQMLLKQLEGSVELDRNHGTVFRIKFKELYYKERT